MTLTYRWLGVAGLEFTYQDYTLLVDPHFTRPGKADVLANRRVPSNTALVGRYITRADAVLVTHPHYDHVLDVPEVLRITGAQVFGTPNTGVLLGLHGIPARQVTTIQVGDRFTLGPFTIDVFPHAHTGIPFASMFNGALPAGLRSGTVRLPLRLSDYRMDTCYGFRIEAGSCVLQVGRHPARSDVLFFSPYSTPKKLVDVLHAARPRWVVPIHWDDFMRPLTQPLVTMLATPMQGLRPVLPPLRRLDLNAFARAVQQTLPGTQVQIPEIFQQYEVET